MITYRERSMDTEHIDRSGWPSGEWDGEPDKLVWIDTASDLDCMIHRNRMGGLCGYVAVPPGHPLHGSGYHAADGEADEVESIEVHGGLTYADACADDGTICHVPAEGRPHDVWWFGFDCGHAWDIMPGMVAIEAQFKYHDPRQGSYKNIAYVTAECERLARQLKERA